MQIHGLALLPANAMQSRHYVWKRGNGPFTQYVWQGQCADDHTLRDSQVAKYVLGS